MSFTQQVLESKEILSDEQSRVRAMVLESCHDIARGKGRDYRDFFDEIQ